MGFVGCPLLPADVRPQDVVAYCEIVVYMVFRMDIDQRIAISYADSMSVFADGEPTIKYGLWKQWLAACQESGRVISPSEFKAAHKGADSQ